MNPNSQWVAINTRYWVSQCGQVLNTKTGKILKSTVSKIGYLVVSVEWPKKSYIHRLVAIAFLPKKDGKDLVNHKDGNKLNNSIENLEWVTAKENINHAFDNNLMSSPRGELSGMSKLSEKQVYEIRKLLSHGMSHRTIARLFNVTRGAIGSINRGLTWSHLK